MRDLCQQQEIGGVLPSETGVREYLAPIVQKARTRDEPAPPTVVDPAPAPQLPDLAGEIGVAPAPREAIADAVIYPGRPGNAKVTEWHKPPRHRPLMAEWISWVLRHKPAFRERMAKIRDNPTMPESAKIAEIQRLHDDSTKLPEFQEFQRWAARRIAAEWAKAQVA